MTEMDTMTQQNASMVQETSGTAESMRDQAGNLSDMINTFVLGDDDAGAAPPSRRSAPTSGPALRSPQTQSHTQKKANPSPGREVIPMSGGSFN